MGEYSFGDELNAAHLFNEPRGEQPIVASDDEDEDVYAEWDAWDPEWREGYGPLEMIEGGVSLIGQDGVFISGPASWRCRRPTCASRLCTWSAA